MLIGPHSRPGAQRLRNRQANGMGGLPLIGDPDAVASRMAQLAAAGIAGIAVSFVNYRRIALFLW
jgi:alkanesulfonate monooxygenase SsuD/methylene tetrahydromethanopterin reductase-like flavin-dependent oxidoreductase (luciferase family)